MIRAIAQILNIYTFLIFIRAILSWFPIDRRNTLVHILIGLTEPILMPLRRIIPLIAGIDITPMVAIVVLQVLSQYLYNFA